MAAPGADPTLQRIERDATIVCVTLGVVAAVVSGWRASLGALAGGLLIAVSYRGIKSGITALVDARAAPPGPGDELGAAPGSGSTAWPLVKFITRYGILAVAAYVMMVRLRAHPVWMLAGATSIVAAVGLEALRQLRRRP